MDNTINEPLVSILMPVYNAEIYISGTIDNILNQTYTNFEFLIFNDGSNDRSAETITSYADDRIKFYHTDNNLGYVKHLNEGIQLAKGKYIARVDADDLYHKDKLKLQVEFLEKNPDYGLCGTWYKTFDAAGTIQNIQLPTCNDDIKIQLLSNNPFGHPTVIIRKEILLNFNLKYNHSLIPAEDYKLWVEISRKTKMVNLNQYLTYYRLHENQISNRKNSIQKGLANDIRIKQIENLLSRSITEEEQQLTHLLFNLTITDDHETLKVFRWANILEIANKNLKIYNETKFRQCLKKMTSYRILFFKNFSIKRLILVRKEISMLSAGSKIKFLMKCILHLDEGKIFGKMRSIKS
ncbi:MAG: glycosyltransferase family 2 protein [Pedobacter sp.]|nr:MAG: glycosyltransferase family 2 protein [Pedobacter sp.]